MIEHNGARRWVCVFALSLAFGGSGVTATAAPPRAPQDASSFKYNTNGLGMDFVMVPAGQFQMGCSEEQPREKLSFPTGCSKDEKPRHPVQITKAFEIGKTEVTQKQWQAVMGSNPSAHKGDVERPVEQVTFEDVQAFVAKLNATNDGFVYRLPTEAEWEYAARGGSQDPYAGPIHDTAWYNDGQAASRGTGSFSNDNDPSGFSVAETHTVGGKKPNAWGLFDMRGNVQEWVQDYYDASYYGSSQATDPKGPTSGDLRVVRGGSFHVYPWLTTVSVRTPFPEAYQFSDLGFRVVREKR